MKYEVIRNNTVYNISDGVPFQVVEIGNIGPAPVQRYTVRGPQQDGDTDDNFKLDPRVIPLLLQARVSTSWSHETSRARYNEIFKSSNVPLKLRITYDNGKVYQIDTHPINAGDLKRSAQDDLLLRTVLQLRAADPLFYDPVQKLLNFGIAISASGFTVPTPVPTFVGTSVLDQTISVDYQGTFRDYPIITVYGPAQNLIIRNLTMGTKIDFTGYTIANGDYYTIDLRYGRKVVYRNGVITDLRTNETTSDSALATFSIESDPEAPNGVNDFKVTGVSANSATQIYLTYYDRYSGI